MGAEIVRYSEDTGRGRGGCLIALFVAIIILMCIGAVAGIEAIGSRSQEGPVIDQGIILSRQNVLRLVGDGPVRIHVSPDSDIYAAAAWKDGRVRHFQIPRTMPPNLAVLNIEEAQEYVLRKLAACGECRFNTVDEVLDMDTVNQMSADPGILRVQPSSPVFSNSEYKEFAEKMVDSNTQVANKALSLAGQVVAWVSVAKISEEGSQAIVAVAVAVAVVALVLSLNRKKERPVPQRVYPTGMYDSYGNEICEDEYGNRFYC